MKEYLKGQFDYIFFFYGFSFFLIALVCFTLGREKQRKLPWALLGAFGLFHGMAEWLDLLMIIYGANRAMSAVKIVLLAISYLCLFEFARIGTARVSGTKIAPRNYLFLLLLLPLAYRQGIQGWLTMARYSLGFLSAYAAARTILLFARNEKEGSRPLVALSALFGIYAVLTGMVGPAASFFPANLVNEATFYDTFGVPVQLVRGSLTLASALAIWFYAATFITAGVKPHRYPVRFIPTKWTIALTLATFISAGWLFTNFLDYYAGIQIIKRTEPQTDSPLRRLTSELAEMGKAAVSMSRAALVRAAVSGTMNREHAEKVQALLMRFREKTGALQCILLDTQGMPLVFAEDNPENETGRSYASRRYFKEALSGGHAYSFMLGPTYNERIYYVSYPVRNITGSIAGVVVIAKRIHAEPLFQYRLFSMAITLLVCGIAIAFFIALRRREAFIALIERAHAQLEEVDGMKTDFISAVSHELRTPLTSIRNAAGILLKGGPAKRAVDDREREMLQIIVDNVDRQTRMVSDLLDVSKIEAGVMPVTPRPTDITALVHSVVTSLKPLAEEKMIEVSVESMLFEKDVYADPELIRRILSNLLVNAIKFTPKRGMITVRIEGAGAEAKITVSDTGIGIPAADREKIFDKFYRSPLAAAQQKQGWGLGLAITKGLVEAQKGRIWVESKPGKGSSFSFTLPRGGYSDETADHGRR